MSTLPRLFAAISMAVSLFPVPASAKADPQIEAAVQAVYPALVRIHVVSEQGGAGRMQKAAAVAPEPSFRPMAIF